VEALLWLIPLVGVGLLVAIEWRERPRGSVQTVELRFGSEDVTEESAEALLAAIAGLPSRSTVALDVVADEHGIRHLVHSDQATLDLLSGQLRGLMPGLRMEPAETPAVSWSSGAALRLSGAHPVLRQTATAEAAASLLGAMQPLGASEVLMLRWQLAAGTRPPMPDLLPRRRGRNAEHGLVEALVREAGLTSDQARLARAKVAGAVLEAVGIVAAAARHPKRAEHLLARLVAVMRSRQSAYGRFNVRRYGAKRVARLLARRRLLNPSTYAPSELAGIVGFPIEAPQLVGVTLGTAPLLMPSGRIPSTGRVLGVSNWPGRVRPLAQPVIGGASHTLVASPTGGGKTALLASLAVQDLEAGRGCLIVDGKGGELADAVLARLPERRTSDVIVLDPASSLPQPGLRLFGRGSDTETTAELVLSIFASNFEDSWGVLSARWLGYGLRLLACDRQATLADLPFVFAPDGAYRRRLLARTDDPYLRAAFAALDGMSAQERMHQLSAATVKLEEFVGRRAVRSVLGQAEPKLDLHDVLRRGKVVVVSVAPERIGASARLIAALVLYKLFEAVMARLALPESQRRPFFIYVDEPTALAAMPVPLDSLFERSRSANVGVTLAAQSLMQLPAGLRAAATSNARSWVVFAQNSADARVLAPELGLRSEELQHLGAFEAVFKIALGPGDVAAPATGRTYPPSPATSDPEAIRRAAAERYGTDAATVEAALRERHRQSDSGAPVGRVRRQP